MRTSMNLPDALLEEARLRAVAEHTTVTGLVIEGLRARLAHRADDGSSAPLLCPRNISGRRWSTSVTMPQCGMYSMARAQHPVIVPDVNVLVYAFDTGSARHLRTAAWLTDAIAGDEIVALPDSVLSGFARIATDRRVLTEPASIVSAMGFVTALLDAPSTQLLVSSRSTWRVLEQLIDADSGIIGNLVPDAYLAAIAISHGGRVATANKGFSRYRSLSWFDPTRA